MEQAAVSETVLAKHRSPDVTDEVLYKVLLVYLSNQ